MNIILCARKRRRRRRYRSYGGRNAIEIVLVVRFLVLVDLAADGGDCRQTEMCADRPWSVPPGDGPRVRVVDAPPGSAVSLLCSYCGEKDKGGEARFWYTSHRYTGGDRKEVALGMADPVESNRVYMTADHSLVIRNLSSTDVGRYSCSGLGDDERVQFALDLTHATGPEPVSADSTAGWQSYESLYLSPVEKTFPRARLVVGVDWDAWGPCDGCAGKRYRRAACRVRFKNGNRTACRSTSLPEAVSPALAASLSSIPDFLLAETCYAYCQLPNRHHRSPKYRNTFVMEEGSSLTLVCAEATADKKVTWRRNGLLLVDGVDTDVESGALVDVFGTLYLVGMTSGDSGNYTCYTDGDRIQEVLVVVRKSSLLASKSYTRHLHYLYYVFALYFVVFSARIYYAFLNRRSFLKITDSDVVKPEIPTPYLGKKIRIR